MEPDLGLPGIKIPRHQKKRDICGQGSDQKESREDPEDFFHKTGYEACLFKWELVQQGLGGPQRNLGWLDSGCFFWK